MGYVDDLCKEEEAAFYEIERKKGTPEYEELQKLIEKETDLVIELLKKKGYLVYWLDNYFEDNKKEKFYINFIEKLYNNYKTIMEDSEEFIVRTGHHEVSVSFTVNTQSQSQSQSQSSYGSQPVAPSREYMITLYPNSIGVNIDRWFKFNTKTNYYEKYLDKFREMESYREFINSKQIVNKFCSDYKLDRSENIDQVLDDIE